jgi:hypothetical protein
MKTKIQLFRSCLVASCLLTNAPSRAAPLNLTPGPPDFLSSSLNVDYVPGSNRFVAVGLTTGYEGGSAPLVNPGSYSLQAFINQSGFLSFGALTINGDLGAGPETLLTGTLKTGLGGTAFGFQDSPGGNIFEFLFTVTGGDAKVVSDFGGLGSGNHGVIVNAGFEHGGVPFNGTWNRFFANDGVSGVADTFVQVPEPRAMTLFLVGAGAWLVIHRRLKPAQVRR